jgi:hypothetical protein
MFHLPNSDRRSELMIIYGEALAADSKIPVSGDGTSLEEADAASAKTILDHARAGLVIRKH